MEIFLFFKSPVTNWLWIIKIIQEHTLEEQLTVPDLIWVYSKHITINAYYEIYEDNIHFLIHIGYKQWN